MRASLPARLLRDESAVAAAEFAIALPVLLLAFYGLVELTRFSLFKDKLESGATQVLDLITQNQNVSVAGLNNSFDSLAVMTRPFAAHDTSIIVSHVVRPPAAMGNCKPVVTWQYKRGAANSRVGLPRQLASLDRIPLAQGDHIMVIEIQQSYTPFFDAPIARDMVAPLMSDVYRRSYARPRYGAFKIDPSTEKNAVVPCIR